MLDENNNLSVGYEAPGEPIPQGESNITPGAFSFSGLKVAEAAGSPVAAADTNGDGLISLRGRSAADRLAHNQEVVGSNPAPVTTSGGHTIGVRPPGQTEGAITRHTVRGLTAFTRNSSPVGFTFKEPLIPNTEWVYLEYREARP